MLDASPGILRFTRPDPVPVERLVRDQRVETAVDLLMRICNLCREAQGQALRLAMGVPVEEGQRRAAAAEIVRDHVMKLALGWPAKFGLPPLRLPPDWRHDAPALSVTLFGPAGAPPATLADLRSWLAGSAGAAPALRRIGQCFEGGAADPGLLPAPRPEALFHGAALENSVAGRQHRHPALAALALDDGHGPLWRAVARLYDLDDALRDRLPRAHVFAPGRAVVAATRGAYAVEAVTDAGRVRSLRRVTPTDHLTAPGGILERALAALPADRAGLAPLLLDVLDPCTPVRLSGGARHA